MVYGLNMRIKVGIFLIQLCAIAFPMVVEGSQGFGSPSLETRPASPPTEGNFDTVDHGNSSKGYGLAPNPASQSHGSSLSPPTLLPPFNPAPDPQKIPALVPSSNPSAPIQSHSFTAPPPSVNHRLPPSPVAHHKTLVPSSNPSAPIQSRPNIAAPPPLVYQRLSPPPVAPHNTEHHGRISGPISDPPMSSPTKQLPLNSPNILPDLPGHLPPSPHQENLPPFTVPSVLVPSALPHRRSHHTPPAKHPIMPRVPFAVTPASPPGHLPEIPPAFRPVPHRRGAPSSTPGPSAVIAPSALDNHALAPPPPPPLPVFESPPKSWIHAPETSPATPAMSHLVPPQASKQAPAALPYPAHPPELLPRSKNTHHFPPPSSQGSLAPLSHSPLPSPPGHVLHAPVPKASHVPKSSPKVASPISIPVNNKTHFPPPVMTLPPPPPNEDCTAIVCTEPLTNTPPGSPCGCVQPMQVGLSLGVALYTFFPLVSELAQEVAAGTFLRQSQVRIMGANAASQQPEKTIVLIDLVPLGEIFDYTTGYLIYQRFWTKQVALKASFFGDYEVLYVRYPGLPPSPPVSPSSISIIDNGPSFGNDNYPKKPFGVDVRKRQHKHGISGSTIAIIALSACVAFVLCSVSAWVLLFKCRGRVAQSAEAPQTMKPAGVAGSMIASRPSSASLSIGSSLTAYRGSAKTFSYGEIKNATDNFDESRVVGEGGFGRVFSGVLEDGTEVAVKVLKRDDQHGDREFMAEVEMLSRLHHRNLVKLIGICTEEQHRSLVYELIPNGSVESHLHGTDEETSPLDWTQRLKIALGAARGLAYLHEDSSPGVIHRDFKSSNILLEQDFTPKVSDFGLARTAVDEEKGHISTRVMGTFGYVAPEYAMTGHLLVKSDVYSYGVVLLELLTGRKPVDMSQPPGQENLVSWARPLLTSKEGLESVIDPSLGSDIPFDSIAKVAAIASMCVQPEVSHRPFMGEVVQALKLVCNECDETQEAGRSRNYSLEDALSIESDNRMSASSSQFPVQSQYPVHGYDSDFDPERGISVSELLSVSSRFRRQSSGSFRRHSSSGPLSTGRGRQFWHRIRRFSGGTVSEHGFRLWPVSR